jgi:hypothetical protein
MQQAIYTNLNNTTAINANTALQTGHTASRKSAQPGAGLVRWIARKWDLVGVLALLGSSAAYGVFALAHTGL